MANQDEQLNSLLEDALSDMLKEEVTRQDDDKIILPKTQPKATTSNSKVESSPEESMDKFFADMKRQLDEMSPDETQAKMSEAVPQIFDLMQNLLSKELLYPALKDLSPKFEEWLEKNSKTISKSERKRYREQLSIINEIIEVFDDESLDSQEVFVKNLDLMERMQLLGAPPSELTVPEGMGKCSVM